MSSYHNLQIGSIGSEGTSTRRSTTSAAKKCDFFHWWDEDVFVDHYKARVVELEKKMKQEHIDFQNKKLKMKEKMKMLKSKKSFLKCFKV
ncbi:hypothetical protein Tco_0755402 [Tanacetum coccineum]